MVSITKRSEEMIKKSIVALLFLISLTAYSQQIATCRAPAGKAYYHFDGLVNEARAGWSDDKISGGVISLSKINEDAFDILYIDTQNKPISSTQDGAIVRLLRRGPNILTLLVFYPTAQTEIYSFFKEKNGRSRFSMMQNRTGDGVTVPKSSVIVGDCDPIRFDLQ